MDVEGGAQGGEGKEGDAAVSLMGGIGGKKIAGSGKASKKRTPGEIRIQKDISELDSGTVANISFPSASDLTNFVCEVTPDSGYWSGVTYTFTFVIPALYPHEPPKVHCETPLYHPNINTQGNVCLNILREDWKPVLDINAVIYGLIYIFYEPNPNDPLNHDAAKLLRENKREFERNVEKSIRGGVVDGVNYKRLR
jgi:ubiquitin-conjugating enzyme E2 M